MEGLGEFVMFVVFLFLLTCTVVGLINIVAFLFDHIRLV